MSFTGKVKNGVVVLPPEAQLADGTEVEIIPLTQGAASFYDRIKGLIKERDWPDDFALNHAHYVKGHPKR